jgi:hypothetical protein
VLKAESETARIDKKHVGCYASINGDSPVEKTALDQFLTILTLPDNIPIVGLLVLVFYFTYLAFREGRKNDQLIEQGREDEILRRMQD